MNRIRIEKLVLRGDGLAGLNPERLRMSLKAGLTNRKFTRRPQSKLQSLVRLRVGPAPSSEQLGRMIADRICQALNE
jgi:hypothetical protein